MLFLALRSPDLTRGVNVIHKLVKYGNTQVILNHHVIHPKRR
ncbi:MAG: Hypothetical protein AJITA_00079 [Acetilactobacillus jinshanensis]